MDLLRKELQRKKAALAKAKGQNNDDDTLESEERQKRDKKSGKKRKYLKARDLRRVEEEEEDERQRKRHLSTRKENKSKQPSYPSLSSSSSRLSQKQQLNSDESNANLNDDGDDKNVAKASTTTTTTTTAVVVQDTTPLAVSRQLRQLGLVIRYYGEDDDGRLSRLQAALTERQNRLKGLSELEEFRLGRGHQIRNEFLQRDDDNNRKLNLAAAKVVAPAGGEKKSTTSSADTKKTDGASGTKADETSSQKKTDDGQIDDDDNDQIIYKYLKGLLKEWEQDLANRPDGVARSVSGRNESKTFKQCKDYIRPLFKLLKSRKLEEGLQFHLLKIVNFAKEGEFVKAHDEYMNVAIGRAAWPIGVTMVGIHARSGRAKIESSNVAHVMNSELQRKYLTSVKRLLTYAQKKRPDVDPSKKVQN